MTLSPSAPPLTPKSDVVDDYHGTLVPDPYRWLENAEDPQVKAWSTAHHERTRLFLDQIPALEKIRARLTELWNYPKLEEIHKAGGKYFLTRNDGMQNQAVLYRKESLAHAGVTLLDPNSLSQDGTVALMSQHYSKDGSKVAYTLAASGSDWQEIHILDTMTQNKHDEVLQHCRFPGVAWLPDDSGFFYSRLSDPGESQNDSDLFGQVYWHLLNTPQSADTLVYEDRSDRKRRFSPSTSEDGKYLSLFVGRGSDRRNGFYVRPLDSTGSFQHLMEDGQAKFWPAGNRGSTFYFLTDLDAPFGRVITVDIENPAPENWTEVIPQGTDTITNVQLWGDALVLVKNHHAHRLIQIYDLKGKFLQELPLPTKGTVSLLEGSAHDPEFFFSFESFLFPHTIFCYHLGEQELMPIEPATLDFDASAYETEQVFCKSRDGTRLPMFLTHVKGLERNGDNPVILYGYGGFTLSQTPFFSVWNLVWLEMGGVFALANIRGGLEYGEEWHQAAMLEKKQNVFDDFIAAAEWLIDQGYTRREQLAIEGRSNGGLLTAACMVQRPELYGAVLCWVPVTDMLRFHKFTVGHFWTSEYGNAEENPEHFKFLYAYSPLHNVKDGVQYPPIILTTGDTDDRVVPSHSKKFIAELLAKSSGGGPHLLRIDTRAGHKLGKPTDKLIQEHADTLAFAAEMLGVKY